MQKIINNTTIKKLWKPYKKINGCSRQSFLNSNSKLNKNIRNWNKGLFCFLINLE